MPGVVTGRSGSGAIVLAGDDESVTGTIFVPNGEVLFLKERGTYRCGVVAATISVIGASNSFVVNESC